MRYFWILISTVVIFYFISCNSLKDLRFKPEDTEYVKNCREIWIFEDLCDTVSINLLLHDKKDSYDNVSWPNLFIGVTKSNDTIGIIDNFTTNDYKKDCLLMFSSYNYGPDIYNTLSGLAPILIVRPKNKENKIYCSIDTVYFGRLLE